jgi:hypothetical protein
MNKYLIFLIPLFIWGCNPKYDTVIDSLVTNYQVTDVSTSNDTLYVPYDSLIVINISFNSVAQIKSVFVNIISPDGNSLNSSSVYLYNDGNDSIHGDITKDDNTFSNKYPFSQSFLNGNYNIRFFVQDLNNKVLMVAEHNFRYNNNITDIPPIVFNLIAPDTASIASDTLHIPLFIQAADSNGLNDIQYVYFNSFLPSGKASSQNPFLLYDDGNSIHGDVLAGDGIYSQIISLPPSGVTLGTYRWEFQAIDRERKISNIIIHNIVVK